MAAEPDGVVEVPYCRVCRRSSELKWRKHVFSTSHQRAAAELLAARVAEVVHTRAQITAARGSIDDEVHVRTASCSTLQSATYCVFCEIKIESWREWVQHYGSPAHRTKLHDFCKHHRCDANRALRPQLCLTDDDALALNTATSISKTPAPTEPTADAHTESNVSLPPLPHTHQSRQAPVQAFLESATTRLQQVRSAQCESTNAVASLPADAEVETKASWMGPHANHFIRVRTVTSPDGIQQNPLGRHDGQRVWGGGIVKVKKADYIPWGMDKLVAAEEERGLGDVVSATTMDKTEGETFEHRWTESARGDGLTSIRRVGWGTTVANVHSATAVPPWMVETEDEYRRCNATQSPQRPRGGHKDIFARLEGPAYDEKSWLPNFGGVWQEGSRLQTRKAFRKTQLKEPTHKDIRASPSSAAFKPLRSILPTGTLRLNEPNVSPLVAEPSPASLGVPTATVVEPLAVATPTNVDTKTMLLLAQKERLRAKVAAKRQAP